MAARKRTSPRKAKAKEPSILSVVATIVGQQIMAHPRSLIGGTTFVVLFSIISANALWYQPSEHPSPLLRTRDSENPTSLIGFRGNERQEIDDSNVTTFKIERPQQNQDVVSLMSSSADEPMAQQQPDQTNLIMAIQGELSRRGLYDGAVDGVMGMRTQAAILQFEEASGLAATGAASTIVLSALKVDSINIVSAIPAERPMAVQQDGVNIDAVAAAIRNSEKEQKKPVITASVPPSKPTTEARNTSEPVPTDMISKIQQGLLNISYTGVEIDGQVGSKTREAIRHFEKHYRLPETGEPSMAVLKKLETIGAFHRPKS